MKIVVATDAWAPQVNGVVRTLMETITRMQQRGYNVSTITPDMFATIPCPGYREIRLAVAPRIRTRQMLHALRPDIVHIATEGPIGWSARSWCIAHDVPFTTAFHTRFPDYAAARTGLSPDRFWPIMRRFHARSRAVLAATPTLMDELRDRGIFQTRLWSRGVDVTHFRPGQKSHPALAELPRPILLSVGRVSIEKNLEAFLAAPVSGSKVVVGDGPALAELKARYPGTLFTGALHGDELAAAYSAADVFVFPSKTDTFGLVLIEALASGLPIAAYPAHGSLDVVGTDGCGYIHRFEAPIGCLDHDLSRAIAKAGTLDRRHCSLAARRFNWDACVDQFADTLIDAAALRQLAA